MLLLLCVDSVVLIPQQGGVLEESLLARWLCQLLLALDYLTSQRVLHRDIKTSNVLLTRDMDAQLGDFGLATMMLDADDGAHTLSHEASTAEHRAT
jgi:NIMA (never in mitosis gene a)-related kinase 1/4/5